MLKVHMVGLMYFHGCGAANMLVHVPDGTQGMGDIPPHYASLWVEEAQVSSDDWFPGQRFDREVMIKDNISDVLVHVFEYRIPYSVQLQFPDLPGALNCDLGTKLTKIEYLDPDFELDLHAPDEVAQIPVRSGDLQVFKFQRVRVVRWDIHNHGPLLITAKSGVGTKTITLKNTVEEVVFANTSDLLKPHDHDEGQHLKLYSKLKKSRRISRLRMPPEAPSTLPPLEPKHEYLKALDDRGSFVPAPGCEGTCC